jgi:hypothetical protein
MNIQNNTITKSYQQAPPKAATPVKDAPYIRTGETTGFTGPFLAAIDAGPLKRRVKEAIDTGSSEGKFYAFSDLAGIPLKTVISIGSAVKLIFEYFKGASNLLTKIGYGLLMGTLSIGLAVVGAIYLTVEFALAITGVVKSCNFASKEKIRQTLNTLDVLTVTDTHNIDQIRDYLRLKENSDEIGGLISEGLEGSMVLWSDDPETRLLQYKAIITRQKIDSLRSRYLDTSNPKKRTYLNNRIGATAVDAFDNATKNLDHYDAPTISLLEKKDLIKFNKKGTNLLSLLDTRRKKVLKIHAFSLVALAASALAIGVSVTVLPVTLPAVSMAVSALSIATSSASSIANDTYLENTGQGVNLRLAIPKALCREKGKEERNFSIWRAGGTAKKIAYVFLAILTGGLFLLGDWTYKSKWISELRGVGDQFTQKDAVYSEENITLPDPYSFSID